MTAEKILKDIFCSGMDEMLRMFKLDSTTTFSDIVSKTQKKLNEVGVELLEAYLAEVDNNYCETRDSKRILVKNKTKTKRMLTSLGEIVLRRRLYFDKTDKRYFFAIDEDFKIEKYVRMDEGLQGELLSAASQSSYGKASALVGNKVSRQTVHNLVKRTEPLPCAEEGGGLRTIGNVFIEADEDHIHLNNGKSAEVKLIYVHEGSRKVCKGRTELVNPRYFTALDNPKELWENVYDYVTSNYSYRGNQIHVTGDGAAWIKGAQEVFWNAQFHLDKFHMFKSITGACYGDKQLRAKIIAAVRERDEEQVDKLYSASCNKREKRSERKTIAESLFYLKNNFENIDLTTGVGCAAEGHVSHVLSSRMSSRPMGWSVEGARRIANLRVHIYNGGDFETLRRIASTSMPTLSQSTKQRNDIQRLDTVDSYGMGRVVGMDGLRCKASDRLRKLINNSQFSPR